MCMLMCFEVNGFVSGDLFMKDHGADEVTFLNYSTRSGTSTFSLPPVRSGPPGRTGRGEDLGPSHEDFQVGN